MSLHRFAGPGKVSLSKLRWGSRACALLLFCATTGIALPAQTLTTLYSFDGRYAYAPVGLVQATNGDFYGTTVIGGAGVEDGYGTIFKVTPGGAGMVLHTFCEKEGCPDGAYPNGRLVQATNGDFYGTTSEGGANGDGTVFKIAPSGTLTTLHTFDGTDGSFPCAMFQAGDGGLYGTTGGGGASAACSGGCGTIFKITPSGALTTLHSFGGTDGEGPCAMTQTTDGNLYGTTGGGGASAACSGGCGTVFKITPSGALTTLYSFNLSDGERPAALIQARNGDLYGTTYMGGANGFGTVFKITPGGALSTLHSFDGSDRKGPPWPNLGVQATNGDFYGTTELGGKVDCKEGCGTIFKITPSGTLTTLRSFDGTDGGDPSWLIQATNGDFYGTTELGGLRGAGTVFRLSVGLGPFVETQTTSGKVGDAVKILGTDLTGATSVTFNGTSAVFDVVSSASITTTVPAGATTGTVQVVTPGGTLSSNRKFRVTP